MLKFDVIDENDQQRVSFDGSLTEDSAQSLMPLLSNSGENFIFNFRGIDYVNSQGVKNWINFLRAFEVGRNIVFEECPVYIVVQINMIKRFKGSAVINSFFSDFNCESCDHEQSVLFDARQGYENLVEAAEAVRCERCNSAMELEGSIDFYFDFLKPKQ